MDNDLKFGLEGVWRQGVNIQNIACNLKKLLTRDP